MKFDKWTIRSKFPDDPIEAIIKEKEKAGFILNPLYDDLSDPYLINDLSKAKSIILSTISDNGKIGIFMDYDADGVCAGAILYKTFKYLGGNCVYYVPQRNEGYGLNKKAIDNFHNQGVDLIITVDCGIKNIEEVNYANVLGINVVITDHHLIGDSLPKAKALVHPMLGSGKAFKYYSGAGVAFQLSRALLDDRQQVKWFLDLAAISTIADIVPLVGDNRILAKYGFLVLNKTKNIGLKFLIKEAGLEDLKIGSYEVGYILAPRLNAAGRIAKPEDSFKLLITNSKDEAETLSAKLNQHNLARQKQLSESVEEAFSIIAKERLFLKNIIIVKSNWAEGIIGLIAGKITNQYNRPSIVFTQTDGRLKGSARSISSIDIVHKLSKFDDLLLSFGGHKQAAGLSLEKDKFDDFKKSIESDFEKVKKDSFKKELIIDVLTSIDKIDLTLAKKIEQLAPFGMGNPYPIIGLHGVFLNKIRFVGKDGDHMSLFVCDQDRMCKAILFGYDHSIFEIEEGEKYDIAFKAVVDRWNSKEKINLHIVDVKKNK